MECGELKKRGNFGIGTFDGLDGEMIQLDGGIYQVRTDGKAYVASNSQKAPFAVNLFFQSDKKISVPPNINYAGVQAFLDSVCPSKNKIYAIKIIGEFSYLKTRSVPKHEKPYPPLAEAVKNQKLFEFRNVRGTLVGFRFPEYLQSVNVPGYHFHFLTEDRAGGGHLLDFQGAALEAQVVEARSFTLEFPSSEEFSHADLGAQ